MTEAAVVKDVPANPCCALWKDKLSKLQQKCTKLEEGRTALRRGIEIYARQIDQMQTEITNLKKACEEERSHRENERKEKLKESATRVSLEIEISSLKSEISSLRQGEGLKVESNEELMLVLDCDVTEANPLKEQLQEAKSAVDSERKKAQEEKKRVEDALKNIDEEKRRVDEELTLLQSRICDRETEINLLTKHLQEERIRAGLEEKKKAEAEKKAYEAYENAKAEKMRTDEELTLLRSLLCENESEINLLREQLQEVRVKAASQEKKKAEAEKRKLDEALENVKMEKLRVGEELTLLRSLVSEKETEINLLKEQLQELRVRVDSEETKKADAEKNKADETCESARREPCGVKGLHNDKEGGEGLSIESMRLCLEDEISSLNSQILSLQEEGGSRAKNVNEELALLRVHVSEQEKEINRLKELLDEERMRADSEKKKAEAEKKNGSEAWEMVKEEKCRVEKERMIVDSERKKATEYRLQLENLKFEADEARSKLLIETLKCEEANEKLEAERQQIVKEKKLADSEKAKAEKLRKLAEINKSNASEEKCRADLIFRQLEEERQRFEKLKKEMEELQSSRQMVEIPVCEPVKGMNDGDAELGNGFQVLNQEAEESNSEKVERRLVEANQKEDLGKNGCDLEMRKSVELISLAEAYRKMALEEKARADKLTQQLKENSRLPEDLRKQVELVSTKKLLEPSLVRAEKDTSAEMRLLRKELKLEKSRVKHAKQVAQLEKSYKNILEQELYRIKTDFAQFSHRLELCNCLTNCNVGNGHPAKSGCSNSKRKRVNPESHHMHRPCTNDQLQPSCAYMEASDCLKQSRDCSTLMLGNQTESTSGIASKLQPLLRGSNRKTLHSSAIDSSMASFSDNPLVGSQARGAFSVSKSAEWDEEQLKSQFPIPRLSGEVNRTQSNKVVMKNGVRNPLDGVMRVWLRESGERILNTAELAQHFSVGKKWHPEILESGCRLYHVLASQMKKPFHELGCVLTNLQDSLHAHKDQHQKKIFTVSEEEGAMMHLYKSNFQKDDLGTKAIEGSDVYLHTPSPLNNITGTAETREDYGRRYLECFEKVVEGNYTRLLDLDDTSDEESYRLAIERPLSPTLPEIEFRSSETIKTDLQNCSSIGCFLEKPSNLKVHTAPHSAFDTVNERVDSNLSELGASEILDSLRITKFDKNSKSDTLHTSSACQIHSVVKRGISSLGNKGSKILFDSNSGSTHDSPPLYCVVFTNFKESGSLSKIFFTTRTLKNQCHVLSQADLAVKKLMVALLEIDDLVSKEKACVLFSMLLDNCYWNFKNHIDGDFAQFLDFSVKYMMKVMSELETRSVLVKLCILDELITLIEDFLIDRRVLVHIDGTQPSTRVAILNCGDIHLSFQSASPYLLLYGAIALAALCAEFDCVGFLCEASYNIAQAKKLDSLMSTILHVFAYVCGNEYFALNDYSLVMTVMKSLVTFLENESRSTPASFHQSMALVWPEFPVCSQCPFYEGALSIDELTTLLLEKLLSYNCLQNFGGLTCKSHTDFDGTLCKFADVLSLLELTASIMSWEWTCNSIVGRLLTVLESPILENGLTASLILLGQLLRIGVEAKGTKDSAVKNIKLRLCTFLSQSTARQIGLPVQIATVSALLGIIPLSFEEVIESITVLPEFPSLLSLAECVRKWYSLLSNEQKHLSHRLLKSDMSA